MKIRLLSIIASLLAALLSNCILIGCGGGGNSFVPTPTPISTPTPTPAPTPTPVPSVTTLNVATDATGNALFSPANLQIQLTDLVTKNGLPGVQVTLLQQGTQEGLIIMDPAGQYAPAILLLPNTAGPARIRSEFRPLATTTISIALTDRQFITNANSTIPIVLTGSMWSFLGPFYTCSTGPLSNVDTILEAEAEDELTVDALQPSVAAEVEMIADVVAPEIAVPVEGVFLIRDIGKIAAVGSDLAALGFYQAKGYQPTDQFEICQVNGAIAHFFLDHAFKLRPLGKPSGTPLFGSSITGTVSDASTGLPINLASVNLAGPTSAQIQTGPDGKFQFTTGFSLFTGSYSLSASSPGYIPSAGEFTLTAGQNEVFNLSLSKPAPATCVPAGAIAVLVHGSEVDAYVPDGSFQELGTGVDFVLIEPPGTTGIHIPTPNPVNSCSSNPASGVTVCTANNTDIYTLSGITLNATLTSAGSGVFPTTGGDCTNCGVAIDPSSNRAAISVSLANGTSTGYQFLDLGTNTLDAPIPTEFTTASGPKISESFAIAALAKGGITQRFVLSPSEAFAGAAADYQLIDISFPSSPNPLSFSGIGTTLSPLGDYDSAAADCSTGIALATQEFTSNIFIADLSQLASTPATTTSPATWNAPSQLQSLPEFAAFTSGTTAITVAPSSHLALLIDEFGAGGFGALRLPSTSGSGTPAVLDWVTASIPADPAGNLWSMPLDPHGLTAYTSPTSGKAMGLMMNRQRTFLAVVDLQGLLSAARVGSHTIDPTVDLIAAGIVSFVRIR